MEEARRVEVVAELGEGQDDAASPGAVAEKVLENFHGADARDDLAACMAGPYWAGSLTPGGKAAVIAGLRFEAMSVRNGRADRRVCVRCSWDGGIWVCA